MFIDTPIAVGKEVCAILDEKTIQFHLGGDHEKRLKCQDFCIISTVTDIILRMAELDNKSAFPILGNFCIYIFVMT